MIYGNHTAQVSNLHVNDLEVTKLEVNMEWICTQLSNHTHSLGFPDFSSFPVPSVPRSSFVGSLLLVSAFRLTGSPIIDGFVFILSCATSFNERLSSCWSVFVGALLGLSCSVGWLSAVSAFRLTGSPNCEGAVEFFSVAICFRDLLSWASDQLLFCMHWLQLLGTYRRCHGCRLFVSNS